MFVIPMWTQRIWKGSEMRVLSCVNIEFLHVVAYFFCIFEVCELYSDMQKSGLDILSIDSVLTLRPHWFPAVRAFFMGVKKGSPTWRRGWVIQSKKISWCWSPLESNKINHKTNYKQEYWCQEFSGLFFFVFYKKDKITESKIWSFLLIVIALYRYS